MAGTCERGNEPSGSIKVKVKVEVLPRKATKAQRRSRGIALPFHDLGA